MKALKNLAIFSLVVFAFASCNKTEEETVVAPLNGVKLIVTVPANTVGDIHVVGSYDGKHDGADSWKPEKVKYKLTKQGDGTYSVTLPNEAIVEPLGLEYKYVAGNSWAQVEATTDCKDNLPNRKIEPGTKNVEKKETIVNWFHLAPCK